MHVHEKDTLRRQTKYKSGQKSWSSLRKTVITLHSCVPAAAAAAQEAPLKNISSAAEPRHPPPAALESHQHTPHGPLITLPAGSQLPRIVPLPLPLHACMPTTCAVTVISSQPGQRPCKHQKVSARRTASLNHSSSRWRLHCRSPLHSKTLLTHRHTCKTDVAAQPAALACTACVCSPSTLLVKHATAVGQTTTWQAEPLIGTTRRTAVRSERGVRFNSW